MTKIRRGIQQERRLLVQMESIYIRKVVKYENFMAEAHELALQLEFHTAVKKPKLDTNRREFYRVSDRGTKHAGYICTSESNKKRYREYRLTVERLCGFRLHRMGHRRDAVENIRVWERDGKDKEDVGVSPAGWLTSLPLLEPHYQILFAHALATGYIECDGKRTEFIDAFLRRENWGTEVSLVNGFGCNVIRSHYPDLSVACTGANRGQLSRQALTKTSV